MTPISLDDLNDLPALKPSAIKILHAIEQNETDAAELAQSVQRDIGLTARILRVANSSYYGFSGQIASVKDACVLLGVHTVRNLAFSSAIVERFSSSGDTKFDHRVLWKHGLGTAAVSTVLAKQIGLDESNSFVGGLLHDLGRVVLATHFPKHFVDVLGYQNEHGCLMCEAEEAVLGIDHSIVGEQLAKKWHFPNPICRVIGSHHWPDREPQSDLVRLIHVADIVCRGLKLGHGGDNSIPPVDEKAVKQLGLQWDKIGTLFKQMEETYQSLSPLLESPGS